METVKQMHLKEVLRESPDVLNVLGLSIWSEGAECLKCLHLDTSHFQKYTKVYT